ncbi:MAG: ChaN family lipoprotein, partial [Planctomycetota bacterium]|nr:ChaN family lipoprotein [Planctomycetota bacterium]
WKASLPEADQAFLPEETSVLDDEYSAKFMRLMGEARGTSFFRSQSLWDDSMAEAMVDFKADHPDHRILFIVGAFHVTKGLGTITKYRMRRGKDEVRILTMTMDADPSLGFKDHDLGLGDLVLKVPQKTRARRKHGTTPKAAPKATKAPQS